MMRRTLSIIALLAVAVAVPASAQMPPSIKGPIDAAKRQAGRTSAQINEEQKVGGDQGTKAAAPKPAPSSAQAKPPAKAPAKAAAKADTKAGKSAASPAGSVTQNGTKAAVTFYREVFSYGSEGRRDPFVSLMATGELRPMLADLALVGIIYDESGRNSVAILVDASAGGQTYRKKVGESLGRIKVTRITDNDVTLNVDEFGFDRQETLLLDHNPRTGARRPQ